MKLHSPPFEMAGWSLQYLLEEEPQYGFVLRLNNNVIFSFNAASERPWINGHLCETIDETLDVIGKAVRRLQEVYGIDLNFTVKQNMNAIEAGDPSVKFSDGSPPIELEGQGRPMFAF